MVEFFFYFFLNDKKSNKIYLHNIPSIVNKIKNHEYIKNLKRQIIENIILKNNIENNNNKKNQKNADYICILKFKKKDVKKTVFSFFFFVESHIGGKLKNII